MADIQKRVDDFFSDMNREDFIHLLTEAGFEVEDGEGKVIFTGENSYSVEDEIEFSIKGTYKTSYRHQQPNNEMGVFTFPDAV